MTELKAFNAPNLTHDVARELETVLEPLSGVEELKVVLDKKELYIVFNECHLSIQRLAQILKEVGCPLYAMGAVIIL